MTKKLLALVLVAVMAFTTLAIPTFASTVFAFNSDKKQLELSWTPVNTDDTKTTYNVVVTLDDKSFTSKTVTLAKADNTTEKCKATFPVSQSGTYNVAVTATGSNGMPVGTTQTGTETVNIPITSGKLTVTPNSSAGNVTVSWTGDGVVTRWYVEYVTSDNTKSGEYTAVNSPSLTISKKLSELKSITVYQAKADGSGYTTTQVGAWTNSGTPATPSNPGTGSEIVNNGFVNVLRVNNSIYLSWNASTGVSYRLNVIASNGQTASPNIGMVSTYTIPGCYNNVTYAISLADATTGAVVASATVPAITGSTGGSTGGTTTTSGALTITKYTSTATVAWNAYPGALSYIVAYTPATTGLQQSISDVYNTYATVPMGYNDTWSVMVYALTTNTYQPLAHVGSATVTPSGITQTGGSSSGSGSGSGTVSGTTTYGTNCFVVSSTTSAHLSWTSTGAASYTVIMAVEGNSSLGKSITVASTSVTLPISNQYAYQVMVLDSNRNLVASASVAAQSSGSGSGSSTPSHGYTKSEISGINVEAVNGWQTKVSWNPVSGVSYYKLIVGVLGAQNGDNYVTVSTNYNISFGFQKDFQVYVYACYSDGRQTLVGKAINVAANPLSNTGSSSGTSTVNPNAILNFKASITTDGKIKLAWNPVEDASSYTIYYKKATSNTWTALKSGGKVYKATKTAINLKGLTKNIEWDFYIESNTGKKSGELTIKNTVGVGTVTAPNPTTSTTNPTVSDSMQLTSVKSNSKGSITVTWNAVKGATQYKVYAAKGDSSSYKKVAEVKNGGTTATITGLDSGVTYKIRAVVIPYTPYESLSKALAACDYLSVTVK